MVIGAYYTVLKECQTGLIYGGVHVVTMATLNLINQFLLIHDLYLATIQLRILLSIKCQKYYDIQEFSFKPMLHV